MVNAVEFITNETLDCRCTTTLSPLNPRKFPTLRRNFGSMASAFNCQVCLKPTTPNPTERCCCNCFKLLWPGVDGCPAMFDAGIRTVYLVTNTDACEWRTDNITEGDAVMCRWTTLCGDTLYGELLVRYDNIDDEHPSLATLTMYFYGDGSFTSTAEYTTTDFRCNLGGDLTLSNSNDDSGCDASFPLSLRIYPSSCIERRPGLCPANDGAPLGLTIVATIDELDNRSAGGYFAGRTDFSLFAVNGNNGMASGWRWPQSGTVSGQYLTVMCESPCSAYGYFTITLYSNPPWENRVYSVTLPTPVDDVEITVPRTVGGLGPSAYVVKLNW